MNTIIDEMEMETSATINPETNGNPNNNNSGNGNNMGTHQNTANTTSYVMDASYLDDDQIGLMLTNDLQRVMRLNHNGPNGQGQDDGTYLINGSTLSSVTGSILDCFEMSQEGEQSDDIFKSVSDRTNSTPPTSENLMLQVPHPTPSGLPAAGQNSINFSTDSLDKSLLSCKKPNYTLTFNNKSTENKQFQQSPLTMTLPPLDFLPDLQKRNKPERKKRPISCFSKIDLTKLNDKNVPDFESLKVLLPQSFVRVMTAGSSGGTPLPPDTSEEGDQKPAHLREKWSEEKEEEDVEGESDDNVAGGSSDKRVKMRRNLRTMRNRGGHAEQGQGRNTIVDSEVRGVVQGIKEVLDEFDLWTNNDGDSDMKSESESSNNSRQRQQDKSEFLTSPVNSTLTSLTKHSPHSVVYSHSTHGRLITESLCPALYALFSDGLLDSLDTLFGRVQNGVWRVVEASVMGGASQILMELVMRINAEELIGVDADGPLKFNAFMAGVMNLGTLPSYLSLLRTKESLLHRHYAPSAFFYSVNTSNRSLYDQMLANMKPLNKIRYELDIFYEVKVLHCRINSGKLMMKNMTNMKRSWSDERVVMKNGSRASGGGGGRKGSTNGGNRTPSSHNYNPNMNMNTRLPKSKTREEIHKVGRERDRDLDTDKFRKLQMQWEMRSNKSNSSGEGGGVSSGTGMDFGNSKIPRLKKTVDKERERDRDGKPRWKN